MRQMNFQVSHLAYVQDIEALDKKINALAEVSHYNDVNMASIQETYTTVDEVNEALSNYVLKSDIPPTINMDEYLTENELCDSIFHSLSYADSGIIEGTINDGYKYIDCIEVMNNEINVHLLNDVHLKMRYLCIHVVLDYRFIIEYDMKKEKGTCTCKELNVSIPLRRYNDGNNNRYWINGEYNTPDESMLCCADSYDDLVKYENINRFIVINESDNGPNNKLTATLAPVIESMIDQQIINNFALKSQIKELKVENMELKTQLITLQPKYPWTDYYKGFDERVEFLSFSTPITHKIYFRYDSEQKLLRINSTPSDLEQNYQYLFILTPDAGDIVYIRFVPLNSKNHINEIYGEHKVITWSGGTYIPDLTLEFYENDSSMIRYFKYIFKKHI